MRKELHGNEIYLDYGNNKDRYIFINISILKSFTGEYEKNFRAGVDIKTIEHPEGFLILYPRKDYSVTTTTKIYNKYAIGDRFFCNIQEVREAINKLSAKATAYMSNKTNKLGTLI